MPRALARYFPLILAAACVIALLYWRDAVLALLVSRGASLSTLFSAVFDWAAIQTGFLFSVYGFLVGKTDGFVAAVKKTEAMARFNRQLGRAMITGFVLTAISMGLIVVAPMPAAFGFVYLFVAAWLGLFVWAFIAFLRVAYLFGVIVKTPDRKDLPA